MKIILTADQKRNKALKKNFQTYFYGTVDETPTQTEKLAKTVIKFIQL